MLVFNSHRLCILTTQSNVTPDSQSELHGNYCTSSSVLHCYEKACSIVPILCIYGAAVKLLNISHFSRN